jgi:hypothetical protein
MSDLSDLQKYLDKKAEEDRAFQQGLVEQLRPAERDKRTPAEVMSAGYAQSAEERAAAQEDDAA